ncbi:hypothetical protein KCG44_13470 [Pacificimonas sp. WHA3]|uniref:Cyclase n=1 Tax=Pacificimonas pallii TaxID=2827236 RepID=A0ABS6SHS0_9SPHN|nr:hypothetical protein [Pacificimonas pallii]MBV7257790.1 hypothetical protein [Pacificimonas pallii]
MKPFSTLVGVRKPLRDIATAVRDRLPEIAPSLADVTSIRVTDREEIADGCLRLVNEWRVDPKLPSAVRQAIPGDRLGWNDHALWTADLTQCTWRIEPFFMPGAIRCAGTTRFETAMGGRGTKAVFTGEFDVDPAALSRIPVAWRGAATSAIEMIVGSMIPRNFRKTIEAAAALLD